MRAITFLFLVGFAFGPREAWTQAKADSAKARSENAVIATATDFAGNSFAVVGYKVEGCTFTAAHAGGERFSLGVILPRFFPGRLHNLGKLFVSYGGENLRDHPTVSLLFVPPAVPLEKIHPSLKGWKLLYPSGYKDERGDGKKPRFTQLIAFAFYF